jgi:hypothetical protein
VKQQVRIVITDCDHDTIGPEQAVLSRAGTGIAPRNSAAQVHWLRRGSNGDIR